MKPVSDTLNKNDALQSVVQIGQTQLNRHFVFNTLTSLNYLVLAQKPTEAVKYVNKLVNYQHLIFKNIVRPAISILEEVVDVVGDDFAKFLCRSGFLKNGF